MVNFEKVAHFSRLYDFLNRYLRISHNFLYYKKVHIVGRENIPQKGVPTFVISNHQNGLMDALAILYLFNDRRQPVYIARGDIFRKKIVAKILRFLKIMPTYRSRDGGRKDIEKNTTTFSIAAKVLNDGGTLAVFPEAGHQAGRFLSTFKKGFARIAFQAEENGNFQRNLQMLPLYIHYGNYFNFRSELLIVVGKPFTFQEYFQLYQQEPNQAILNLMEKSRQHIKSMALDIADKTYYRQYDLLREMFHTPLSLLKKKEKNYFYQQLQEDIQIVKNIDDLKEKNSHDFENLMEITREYEENLTKIKLRNWVINNTKITFPQLFFHLLFLCLVFPFFAFGFLHNILPFSMPNLLKRKIKDPMLHSSVNFAVGVIVSFPIMYIIIFTLCWILFAHFFFALGYVIAVFLSLFLFYFYKKSAIKWWASWRYWILKRKNNATIQKLEMLKKEMLTYKKYIHI